MSLFTRHKSTVVLAVVLLAQLLALAVQVKRQTASGPVRVIRLMAVSAAAPVERMFIHAGGSVRGLWENYVDLRGVRKENRRLRTITSQLLLENAHEQEELRQAQRLRQLLDFKQSWIDTTVAAQVIGTSGMESSRLLYLDKGAEAGIRPDMPVITPHGIVGKILNVYGNSSQVLLINDATSGVGAILSQSRLQGIVKGTPTGELKLSYIMEDQTVKPGEEVVTSGGDRVYPKGLPIGTVTRSGLGHDLFLDIRVKPAADLSRLEEVLIITRQKARAPDAHDQQAARASDILASHLPSVPETPPPAAPKEKEGASAAPAGSSHPAAAPKTQAGGGARPAAPSAKPKENSAGPEVRSKTAEAHPAKPGKVSETSAPGAGQPGGEGVPSR